MSTVKAPSSPPAAGEPGQQLPECVDIEIVERRPARHGDGVGADIVIPNEIRINGRPVLAPADRPVIVHGMELRPNDAVLVTLTLFARRVFVSAEDSEPEMGDPQEPEGGEGEADAAADGDVTAR